MHSTRSVFGPSKKLSAILLAFSLVFLGGCYAFVNDEEPPAWEPDPADVAQQFDAAAAGSGGPGAAVFNAKCAVCHQMSGEGIPGVYPTLKGSAFATGDPGIPIRIVLHGFQGPIERGGKQYNGVMQPWQNDLDDQQIADVLTFVRTSWGNSAPAVTPEEVAAVRKETKGKIGAYSEAELLQ